MFKLADQRVTGERVLVLREFVFFSPLFERMCEGGFVVGTEDLKKKTSKTV